MNDATSADEGQSFLDLVMPIIRKVIENIDSPYVWMPLGLFVLCIAGYPFVQDKLFAYAALLFAVITFAADWVYRWKNRRPGHPPGELSAEALKQYLIHEQARAVKLTDEGKVDAARTLTKRTYHLVKEQIDQQKDDETLFVLLGYICKDAIQTSQGQLPESMREAYFAEGEVAFERALQIEPRSAEAVNGLGNLAYLRGDYAEAIRLYDQALQYASAKPFAEVIKHDRALVVQLQTPEAANARALKAAAV